MVKSQGANLLRVELKTCWVAWAVISSVTVAKGTGKAHEVDPFNPVYDGHSGLGAGRFLMIVSAGRSYIFVHIPKTGGTALALALEQRAMKDDILLGDTPKAVRRRNRKKQLQGQARGRLWKHASLADIEGILPDDQLRAMFTFTLVRNPWDRVVSYYHWLRVQNFDHAAVALAKRLEFEDFVLNPDILQSLRQSLARAYMTRADGTEQCDAYIRLEDFARDAAPLKAHLGFDLILPRYNMSDRARDYTVYFTTRSKNAVATACAEDIERFGYSFGQ